MDRTDDSLLVLVVLLCVLVVGAVVALVAEALDRRDRRRARARARTRPACLCCGSRPHRLADECCPRCVLVVASLWV